MRHFLRLRYPKLLLLLVMTILSYLIFTNPYIKEFVLNFGIGHFGYISSFTAGILMAFGFSAPIAIGFFIISQPQNIVISAILGGLGAILGDLLIFNFVRFSFIDEFKRLERTKPFRAVIKAIEKNTTARIRNYILYIFAEIIIASPVSDEIGITMLAGLTSIKQKIFSVVTFFVHAVVILIILALSH
ncbi:hypothetical protein HYT26_02135 [Candidatus Pacearchaeota archaeon]|nr:hypothetical protein [Candidatus Pacearchaeota archaeon]